jgi:hypothetical protein
VTRPRQRPVGGEHREQVGAVHIEELELRRRKDGRRGHQLDLERATASTVSRTSSGPGAATRTRGANPGASTVSSSALSDGVSMRKLPTGVARRFPTTLGGYGAFRTGLPSRSRIRPVIARRAPSG